jgi:hypothetical protein
LQAPVVEKLDLAPPVAIQPGKSRTNHLEDERRATIIGRTRPATTKPFKTNGLSAGPRSRVDRTAWAGYLSTTINQEGLLQ